MGTIYKFIIKHPLLAALIINALFLVCAVVLCDPKYETADDFITEAVLSGALSGQYDPHIMYSNILLGYGLKFLYELIPTISFYFVYLVALGFFSSTAVVWLVLRQSRDKGDIWVGILISIIFLVFFTDDLYILPQFTKAASIANTAGGLVFLCGLWENGRKKIVPLISGVILVFCGSLLRYYTIFISLSILFIVFAIYAIRQLRDTERSSRGRAVGSIAVKFVCCGLLVLMSLGLTYLDLRLWNKDPNYAQFRHMDPVRSDITDAPEFYTYDEISADLDRLGLDMTDYVMLNTWGFTDRGIYSEETLRSYKKILKEHDAEKVFSWNDVTDAASFMEYGSYQVIRGLLILALSILVLYRKHWLSTLIIVLATFLIMLGFIYIGRTVYRAEYGVIVSGACALCAIPLIEQRREYEKSKVTHIIVPVLSMLIILSHIGLYFPDTMYKSLDDDRYYAYAWNTLQGSGGYEPQKYSINVSSRRPCAALLDRIENDKDNYYLMDFKTLIHFIAYNYNPWVRLDRGYFRDNYFFIGGLTMMQHPAQSEAFEHNGIDTENPYKSLVNGNIYLIDNYFAEIKLEYLRKYYYPDVEMAEEDEINMCKIWRFSIPEEVSSNE